MRKLLSLFLLLYSAYCIAQNYQCLQPGVKRYFINANGYLRGIRVDSVTMTGDTTVYHLFHTARGNYEADPWHPTLDSTRGSWVGRDVIQLADGTFIFDNYDSKPITIKTQAGLSESWIFQGSPTNPVYYRATIGSIDTMHILGDLDTVKRIVIYAYSGSYSIPSDPLSGYKILLSKNHGFAGLFDLYTFPYDSADYYHERCGGQAFELVLFHSPTDMELYDWHVGDVYEYAMCYAGYLNGPLCYVPDRYVLDTIKSKLNVGNYTQYTYNGLISNIEYTSLAGYHYDVSQVNSGTFIADTTMVVDTFKMPEEFNQRNAYYYYPDDTSHCIKSPLYKIFPSEIVGVYYTPPFESGGPTMLYKSLLGLISSFSYSIGPPYDVYSKELIYYDRDGVICGGYKPLAIPDVSQSNALTLSPNPATTDLHITAPINITSITITNSIGQQVYSAQYNTKEVNLNVAYYPAGLYFVKINNQLTQKFVKE